MSRGYGLKRQSLSQDLSWRNGWQNDLNDHFERIAGIDEVNPRVKALPISASQNESLLNALKDLNGLTIQDYKNITSKIENIIYKWTGTENITGNRGSFDARKLKAMEELRGEEYLTNQGSSDVQTWQVAAVTNAWNSLVNGMNNFETNF